MRAIYKGQAHLKSGTWSSSTDANNVFDAALTFRRILLEGGIDQTEFYITKEGGQGAIKVDTRFIRKPIINPEADEINQEDLEAAADMYDRLIEEQRKDKPVRYHQVEVVASLYYQIPESLLPQWMDKDSVVAALEAFTTNRRDHFTLQDMGKDGFLGLDPIRVEVDRVQ